MNDEAQCLAKFDETVALAQRAYDECPIGHPLKLKLAKLRAKANNAYIAAINHGFSGNSAAIEQATQSLAAANETIEGALDASEETAKVLGLLQEAFNVFVQVAKLVP